MPTIICPRTASFGLCLALCLAAISTLHAKGVDGFNTLSVLEVGQAPHQIAFSQDGKTAYIAAAGSDKVTLVDTLKLKVTGSITATGVPLGIAVLDHGENLGVSRFRGEDVVQMALPEGKALKTLATGGGSSLFTGPLPDNQWLIVSEQENQVSLIDGNHFEILAQHKTGKRPFPAAVTADGRKVFVPNYDDGTVSVIDLWNATALATVPVGPKPSGGVVLPGDISYAVAVRGENRIDLINVGTHEITGHISHGIGDSPFSVVSSPDGRFAFVNNTASHDISVIDLSNMQVVGRLAVGEIPIVMAVHPNGGSLWVACEGSHELHVIAIRPPPNEVPDLEPTEVLVMGMTHSRHRESKTWGLAQVEDAIRRIDPDAVCVEIPPNRWYQAWKVYEEHGVIEDDRVSVFPEYTDVLFPLKKELGFLVEPCAGWTHEMNQLRKTRIQTFNNDPRFAAQRTAYEQAKKAVEDQLNKTPIDEDDPYVIHSDTYDERTRTQLGPYDEYLNDWIGPGGWTNINKAHYALVDLAIKKHGGKRVLVTFGAGHKYWFLDQLKTRNDIHLLDIRPFLSDK